MIEDFIEIREGSGNLIGTAIHEGSKLRDELQAFLNLDENERLREEDPFTGVWADISDTTIKGRYSRFEVDLNRPREKAVYRTPEDAWGLKVWKNQLPEAVIDRSLQKYDAFYKAVKVLLDKKVEQHGSFVVYDFHSYNHLRDGQGKPPADPEHNPEINLGTANMNRKKWASVVDAFSQSLKSFDYRGRNLDVRENIKFKGGYFSQWIYENYPNESCVIAIEVKKIFMDEWTGTPDHDQINLLKTAFQESIPEVQTALQGVYI